MVPFSQCHFVLGLVLWAQINELTASSAMPKMCLMFIFFCFLSEESELLLKYRVKNEIVASYARLVSEPKAPALDAAAKVRQYYETTKPNTKKLTDEP
jgi:hypothetical protein